MSVKTISKKEMSKLKRLGHAKTDSARAFKTPAHKRKEGLGASRPKANSSVKAIEDELYRKIHRLAQKVKRGGWHRG